MNRTLPAAAAVALATTWSAAARADVQCMTVEEADAYLLASGGTTTTIDITFDVTGVDPNDFAGTKGCLVDIANALCPTGAAANVKVYGPYDPPNTAHPSGTLKFEYFNTCCAVPPCDEGWADPNASNVIFVDGTEQCSVHVWLNATDYGYSIDCGGTVFDAIGENVDGLTINRVAILSLTGGGWEMVNAVATADQACFEDPVVTPPPSGLDVPAIQDVTAASATPDAVYPNVNDLSSEANVEEIFLQFDLSAVPGHVTSASILLHESDDPSADGDGGDAHFVASNAWSETTLTWNGRPAPEPTSLSRVSPVTGDTWFEWDVSAAVGVPGIYSFAIVPQPTDANGAHFFSKEASATLGPKMHVEYDPAAGGSAAGGSAAGGSAAGGSAVGGLGAGGEGAGGATGGGSSGAPAADAGNDVGCGCRLAGSSRSDRGLVTAGWLAAALALGSRARRRPSR